jgi:hypothetical protein
VLDVLYGLAAIMAALGVRKRNLTALPLLASFAFCKVVTWQAVPFNLWLWLAVDALVVAGIVWPLVPIIRARAWAWLLAFRAELVILALFVPGFSAYAMAEGPAHILSTVVATVQLLVTFPYRRFAARLRHTLHRHEDWTHLDLRVRA